MDLQSGEGRHRSQCEHTIKSRLKYIFVQVEGVPQGSSVRAQLTNQIDIVDVISTS
jgi:hypothetical protein